MAIETKSQALTVPIGILSEIGSALEALRKAAEGIHRWRLFEQRQDKSEMGKWECLYRTSPMCPNIRVAKEVLARASQLPEMANIDIAALYDEMGGYVEPPGWSRAATRWRNRDAR